MDRIGGLSAVSCKMLYVGTTPMKISQLSFRK